MNSKISIIVPIYNQEKYLHRSLSSIRKNKFSCFEVILVDDGSTDKSKSICMEYSQKDSRFKYFYKINGGVASARQFGTERACGEYIIHVDPDDWIEEDYLHELYSYAVISDADVVMCDYIEHYTDRKKVISLHDYTHKSIEELRVLLAEGVIWGVCWNKLIKRDFLTKTNISFVEGLDFQEDKLYTYHLFSFDPIISFVNKPLYNYNRTNTESAVSTISSKRIIDMWRVRNRIIDIEPDRNVRNLINSCLFTLGSVSDLMMINDISLREIRTLTAKFRTNIRKKIITKSSDSVKIRAISLCSTSYLWGGVLRILHNLKNSLTITKH